VATQRVAILKVVMRLLLAIAGLSTAAQAQASFEFWPQLETFVGLTPNVQLQFLAGGTVDDSRNQGILLGPSINISLAPFLVPRIRTLNKTRNNFLNFRAGYRYNAVVGDRSSHSHRGLLELTPRLPLPARLVFADRNQFVLVGGQKSTTWLYRNRVTLARSFQVRSLIFSPYLQGQVVYNSDPGAWNRYDADFGSVFRLNDHWELEPYFQHQHSIDGSGGGINGIGFKVELYFHNESGP
jgi:hypothetical protein